MRSKAYVLKATASAVGFVSLASYPVWNSSTDLQYQKTEENE